MIGGSIENDNNNIVSFSNKVVMGGFIIVFIFDPLLDGMLRIEIILNAFIERVGKSKSAWGNKWSAVTFFIVVAAVVVVTAAVVGVVENHLTSPNRIVIVVRFWQESGDGPRVVFGRGGEGQGLNRAVIICTLLLIDIVVRNEGLFIRILLTRILAQIFLDAEEAPNAFASGFEYWNENVMGMMRIAWRG